MELATLDLIVSITKASAEVNLLRLTDFGNLVRKKFIQVRFGVLLEIANQGICLLHDMVIENWRLLEDEELCYCSCLGTPKSMVPAG